MKRMMVVAVLAATTLSVAACGTSPGERALSGGALGAGTGAAVGAIAGSPATGALVGGALGAIGGAVTSPRDVYLGEPLWY